MTSTRCILYVLDSYQKAKITFLQYLYDYTLKKDCSVDQIAELNIVEQIIPLLSDSPNVRSLALTTTVKLCCNSKIATQILEKELLCCFSKEFKCESKEFRRNVLHIVKNISKHADLIPELLQQGKHLLLAGIQDIDPQQREFVLNALTNTSSHNVCSAQQVMNLDILPQVFLCLQCPENLSLEATQLIRALCKQSDDITSKLLEYHVVQFLEVHLSKSNLKLVKQVILCLGEIAHYCEDFAMAILRTQTILCKTILYMSHCDVHVRKSAVLLIKELCKFNADLSKSIVQHGALPGLINAVSNPKDVGARLPAVMALGYMGAQSDQLALAIIHCQGLQEIISAFNTETNESCLKAIVWTIEQLTAHSTHHVTFLNNSNVFARLLRLYLSTSTCPELKAQCLSALEKFVNKCLSIQDIDLLLYDTPREILLPAIKQLIKILSVDPKARRLFVSTGGLQRIQALKPPPGSELYGDIVTLNAQFPDDIVRYYSQRISDEMLAKIEEYTPKVSYPFTCPSEISKLIQFPSEETENTPTSDRSDPGIYPGLIYGTNPSNRLRSQDCPE